MSRRRTYLAILLVLFGLHSATAAETVDVTVCDVLANPASFDGKVVRIKAATVTVGLDEFLVEGSGCNPAAAIWLAYPEKTKAKAGPAAFLRLQAAKNSTGVADAPNRAPITLQRNGDFERFAAGHAV